MPMMTSLQAGLASIAGAPHVATIEKVALDIAVVLGTTSMPVHQVLASAAAPSSSSTLRKTTTSKFSPTICPVAKGTVVVSGNRIAVEVKEMLPGPPISAECRAGARLVPRRTDLLHARRAFDAGCLRRLRRPSCGRGGIGRRASLRWQWVTPWRFESSRPHQSDSSKACGRSTERVVALAAFALLNCQIYGGQLAHEARTRASAARSRDGFRHARREAEGQSSCGAPATPRDPTKAEAIAAGIRRARRRRRSRAAMRRRCANSSAICMRPTSAT